MHVGVYANSHVMGQRIVVSGGRRALYAAGCTLAAFFWPHFTVWVPRL